MHGQDLSAHPFVYLFFAWPDIVGRTFNNKSPSQRTSFFALLSTSSEVVVATVALHGLNSKLITETDLIDFKGKQLIHPSVEPSPPSVSAPNAGAPVDPFRPGLNRIGDVEPAPVCVGQPPSPRGGVGQVLVAGRGLAGSLQGAASKPDKFSSITSTMNFHFPLILKDKSIRVYDLSFMIEM